MCLNIVCTVTLKQCCLFLLSNSVEASDPARLYGLNGLNVTIALIARGLGAIIVGSAFSLGVAHGYVVIPFWILALLANLGVVLATRIKISA